MADLLDWAIEAFVLIAASSVDLLADVIQIAHAIMPSHPMMFVHP